MGAFLSVRDLSVRAGPRLAADRISLELEAGSRGALVGRPGAGKTAILRAIAGFPGRLAGAVLVDGAAVRGPGPDRMVVWQQADQLFPWKTLLENVAQPGGREWLQKLGIARVAHAYPGEVTPAEKFRAALARAFAYRPKILLVDDPFGSLGVAEREELGARLGALQEETGVTMLLTTRDPEESARLARKVFALAPRTGRLAGVFRPTPAIGALVAQDVRRAIEGDA